MDPLIRAIRALTIAVWCLCGLVAAQLALYGWGYMQSSRFMRNAMGSRQEPSIESLARTTTTRRPDTGGAMATQSVPFHDLPPAEKVARSSAILLISYQPDKDRFKAVVAEVLKRNPHTELYYSVGDEYTMLSYYPKDDEARGEGQVVFMVGSPADMRSSYSFDGGRIGGLGDMPLEKLREMVKTQKP